MLGALITIPRDSGEAFSVIMPVANESYEAIRRLRNLGDLRKWLESRAEHDAVAESILSSLQKEVGTVGNHCPLDIHLEIPEQGAKDYL